ncbi:MAG: bifunctional phosphopantothenoylcysteine decarboxylase/phosphopantothenate--cysteine ligase CoaBC [Woeseiaceae bacterium]|nr:bifunctional phosphopantothenoylcysteine decarboxylase/phosphopantothenate--cysteine ligase CoaBC [Woeseiaceae bacterium]
MNIVLGISGGIAAYKTPELVRRLKERGADVQIVMTASAEEFVTETALQAVSGRPIRSNLWDKEAEASMSHIELARWADVVLIAPATAELMSRLAGGSAGDLLTTLCLATEAPIAVAPAMNHVMWSNAAVQDNRQTLEDRGFTIIGPDSGDQACGETGAGRMTEPDQIAAIVCSPRFAGRAAAGRLAGKTVLITAGPTREPIDPVRYITNRSSGKMGYAMARAAAAEGAEVILVSGPVALSPPSDIETVNVETAEEMYAATHERIAEVDIFIGAAAVADYRPATRSEQKIKKSAEHMTIELVRAKDILASVAALDPAPFTVGFAAETENLREYALSKLEKKRLDMIIANQVGRNQGFDLDDNTVCVYWPGEHRAFPTAQKTELAHDLVAVIAERYEAARGTGTEPSLSVISLKDKTRA